MFGEDIDNIGLLMSEKFIQLIDTDNGYPHNFSFPLIIFSHSQFVERLIKLFQLIDDEVMCKHEPLIVGPYFVHLLDKIVGVISLDHVFSSWLNV